MFFLNLLFLQANELKLYKNNELVEYYNNKHLFKVTTYKNEKKNGKCEAFYSDGNFYQKATFLNNKKDGKSTIFYRNGNIYSESLYENGKLIKITKYYKNGKTTFTSIIKEDLYINKYFFNNDQNSIRYKTILKNDKELNLKIYYNNTRLMYNINFKNDNAIEGFFYDKKHNMNKLNRAQLHNQIWSNITEEFILYENIPSLNKIEKEKISNFHMVCY